MVYSVAICFVATENSNNIDFATNSMNPYYKSAKNQSVNILSRISNKAKYVDICYKNRYNVITMFREVISMTDTQQKLAARQFAKDWAGRGDEKQDTHTNF